MALLASPYPAVSIVNGHLLGEPAKAQPAGVAAGWSGRTRPGLAARIQAAGSQHQRSGICSGVGAAGRAVTGTGADLAGGADNDAPAFDFEAWLGQSVQTGLVTGAHLLHTIEKEHS